MNQYKIAIIAPANLPIPAVKGGAIETLVTTFIDCNEQDARYQIDVYQGNGYFFTQKEREHYQYSSLINCTRARDLRYPLQRMAGAWHDIQMRRGYYADEFLLHICTRLRKNPPQVILAEGCQLYVPYLKKCFPDIPVILHVHTDILNPKAQLANEIVATADKILCVSDYIKNRVNEICPRAIKKTSTVLNCVDTSMFAPNEIVRRKMRAKLGYTQEEIVFVYCGRICAEKGVDALVQAFVRLKDTHTRLLVIGASWFSEDEKSDFEKKLEKDCEFCKERVSFTGYIQHDELPQWLCAADVAVVPSVCMEAAPLAALESASVGLPLVATTQGGLPQYTGENALHVTADETLVFQLATAMQTLAEDELMRQTLGKNAIQFASGYRTNDFYMAMCRELDAFLTKA